MQVGCKPDLIQNEIAFKIVAWRREPLRAASDYDHVRIQYARLPKELPYARCNARVKAAQHDGVCDIGPWTRIEMENFPNCKSPPGAASVPQAT